MDGWTLTPGRSMSVAGVGLQSTLSPVNLHSTMVCDMYTCADDVVCCGVITLKCILKEGARRSKRRAAITQG